MHQIPLTSLIHQDDEWYVALCPELDIASPGDSPEQAKSNLMEALALFFESASNTEIKRRLHIEQA